MVFVCLILETEFRRQQVGWAAMASLSEDASRLGDFELAGNTPGHDPFQLKIFERSRKWEKLQIVDAISTDVLQRRDEEQIQSGDAFDLRIINAPLDIPASHSRSEFRRLFEYLEVPSGFVSERLQSVRHSFGGRREGRKLIATWLHFLCRRPNMDEYERLRRHDFDRRDGMYLSQWDRFGLFMRVKHSKEPDDGKKPDAEQLETQLPRVELTLFGAEDDMKTRLTRMAESEGWREILRDPYILLDVILDELYLNMDRNLQEVSGLFGGIENGIINSTASPGQATAKINFRILHNLSKDVIYLEESFDSILHTAESISKYHFSLLGLGSKYSNRVQDSLEYRKAILASSKLQVRSLKNRVQNLIDLAFHLVTQNESRIFQQDSFSMHALALVSLLFVPLASVSSFLGTPYFNVQDPIELGRDYSSVLWGIGSTTLAVFFLWLFWYWSARRQIRKGGWDVRGRLRSMALKMEK
ncbi:hypothetical protein E2P81_ATG05738 [Venturia nashicola]|uniref:Uncharacterized protein n=1 Tax=Venturia nashicola TaxID=86259 RepID=A0A4Z1P3W7_9PEZI|nr:hypothetical protein E6O75_ATG05881 [Venturia nashicola]TLD29444.1 hypothetical protein E2P81_ATG05738 [Venturia nashicola]